MLEDFLEDLHERLRLQIDAETARLVSSSGNERHDLVRGRIHALAEAVTIINELAVKHSGEVRDNSESVQPKQPRRLYGGTDRRPLA